MGTQRRRLDKETFLKINDNEVLYLYTNTILKEETVYTFLIYIVPYNSSRVVLSVSVFSPLKRSHSPDASIVLSYQP